MNISIKKFIKEIFLHTSLRRFILPRFIYNMTVPQLMFLCECVGKTRTVPGVIAEIGCAAGTTTLFINKYLDAESIAKDYYVVDTFSGFTAQDVEYEVSKRQKQKDLYADGFANNKKSWFDLTMKMNGVSRVKSIQADANVFDFATLGPVSFCLLDVDLYRPIKKTLPLLYGLLSAGGMIVVDDCDPGTNRYDGAGQAYREFCRDIDCPPQVVLGKLGIIVKKA